MESSLAFDKPTISRLSPKVLAEVKREVVRIGNNGTKRGAEFAQTMFERYPELLGR